MFEMSKGGCLVAIYVFLKEGWVLCAPAAQPLSVWTILMKIGIIPSWAPQLSPAVSLWDSPICNSRGEHMIDWLWRLKPNNSVPSPYSWPGRSISNSLFPLLARGLPHSCPVGLGKMAAGWRRVGREKVTLRLAMLAYTWSRLLPCKGPVISSQSLGSWSLIRVIHGHHPFSKVQRVLKTKQLFNNLFGSKTGPELVGGYWYPLFTFTNVLSVNIHFFPVEIQCLMTGCCPSPLWECDVLHGRCPIFPF